MCTNFNIFGYWFSPLTMHRFFLLASIIIVVCSCGMHTGRFFQAPRIDTKRLDDLYRFLTYQEDRYPLVSAHRGGPAPGYPENAVETFARSADMQPVIIECDIAFTKDSALVLMHDDDLDRTSTGKGKLKNHTLKELKGLYLKDGAGAVTSFRIPTLDEALQWGKGKVLFTLDVKRGVSYQRVIDAVRRNTAESCTILITYTAVQAAEVHQLAPDLLISASIRSGDDLNRLNEYGVPDNRLLAFVGTSEPNSGVYQLLHDHGILCILGTMGNLDKRATAQGDYVYDGLITRGADILSTDRPVETGERLKMLRRRKHIRTDYIH